MQQTQRRIIYLLILMLGVANIISADKSETATSEKIQVPQQGFLAPEFELKTPKGEAVKLSNLRGQAVLVNSWAT